MPTLVVIRHAKSDWDVPVGDRSRPVAARGRRQAPATGRWMAANLEPIELAVVSVAQRARQTWELVSAELPDEVEVRHEEDAYTFDGDDLLALVRALPDSVGVVALVSHNPAVEELVRSLTGRWVAMPTSAVAVIDCPAWGQDGTVRYAGRPGS